MGKSLRRFKGFIMAFTAEARLNLFAGVANRYRTRHKITEVPDNVYVGSFLATESTRSITYEIIGHIELDSTQATGAGVLTDDSYTVYVETNDPGGEDTAAQGVVVAKDAWSTTGWPTDDDQEGWTDRHPNLHFLKIPVIKDAIFEKLDTCFVADFATPPPFVTKFLTSERERVASLLKRREAALAEVSTSSKRRKATQEQSQSEVSSRKRTASAPTTLKADEEKEGGQGKTTTANKVLQQIRPQSTEVRHVVLHERELGQGRRLRRANKLAVGMLDISNCERPRSLFRKHCMK